MISYTPFWKTLKDKNYTTYTLIKDHNVSRSLIDKLKHNKGINTSTLNDLCAILDCRIEEILEYIKD